MEYVADASTATPVLEGNVHGVVVHTRRKERMSGRRATPPVISNFTNTLGSWTVWYPMATSASESAVPQRGQYVVTRSASTSSPRLCNCFNDHQTDSMYSLFMVQYASDMSIQKPMRSVSRSKSST